MSTTALGIAAIAKAAAPLIKDLYDGAKGGVRTGFSRWGATHFSKKLARQISEIDSVRTIWSPEKNVSLRSFYYPSKLQVPRDAPIKINSLIELGEGSVVIQGIVGQGKSVFLRYLSLQEILRTENPRLPVFLELRKVTKSSPLVPSLFRALSAYDITVDDATFDYLARSGRMVLILDGFDELESSLVRETTLELEHLSQKYPDLQIVVSSRPNNEIQKLNAFRIMEIAPLDQSDYSPFLRSLGLSAVRVADIAHAVRSSPNKVAELITTPLMLTLVVFVYESEKQIPPDLPEFFERLFYTVFTRHDKLKAAFEREHHSGLSERKLQALFEAFCFMSLQLGSSRTLSAEKFTEAFELAQDYVEGSACKETSFKKDITKVACLMLEEGVGETTFLHKSIAEYHAAAFVKSSDDQFAERFYSEASESWEHWQECLRFLHSIDPYRFAKYFALSNLDKSLNFFENLSKCTNGKSVRKSLPDWINKTTVRFDSHDGKKDDYMLSSYGAWSSGEHFYSTEVGGVLSNIAFMTVPGHLTKNQIDEMRAEGLRISNLGEGLSIGFSDALDRWGFASFDQIIGTHLENIRRRISEAQIHADKLQKRALIFDRKKRT
jgi:hypothetical protein